MVHALEDDKYREKMKDVLAQVRNVPIFYVGAGLGLGKMVYDVRYHLY
jgi:hypothetical protein